jgi:2-iminobutanoate/2-iminopropanoate deaminase
MHHVEIISTGNAPAAVGPYSQAIRTGQMVYTAGQIGLDPATGKLVEGDIAAQTEQVLRNVAAILEAAGTDLNHVVKTTVFLQDMGDFAAMNVVYGRYFGDPESGGHRPARSTVAVAALPRPGALVEIEAVAVVP